MTMRDKLKFTSIFVAFILAVGAAPHSVRAQSGALRSQEGAMFLGGFLLKVIISRPGSLPLWEGRQQRDEQAVEAPRKTRATEDGTFNPQIKKSLLTKGRERLKLTGRWLKNGKVGKGVENAVAPTPLASGDSERHFILGGPSPQPDGLGRSHHLAHDENLAPYPGL